MKVLAIDTSSKRCSVCIYDNDHVIINLNNDDEKTHSVKLMPMVDHAFKETGLTLDDISLLVCCIGPGSFTGVRIGISTVKAFADVKNIPVVGITSLESLAWNVVLPGNNSMSNKINVSEQVSDNASTKTKNEISISTLICSLIDAKNNNVYCGLYHYNDKMNLIEIFAEDINTTIEKIKKIYIEKDFSDIIFVGDGAVTYKEIILSSLKLDDVHGCANNSKNDFTDNASCIIKFCDEEHNFQCGPSLAKAGLQKYIEGSYGDSNSIFPVYLRKSQAERALEEKIKILPMMETDIEELSPNFQTEFDEFWNINNLKNDFQNPNSTYFVAKLGNEIVGFAGFLNICDEANIMNIVTKIDKRHLGIGSKLLSHIIASAHEQKCKSITLEVNEHNTYAIHLYEKFNFKRIGLRKKYYNNKDNAIIMSILI